MLLQGTLLLVGLVASAQGLFFNVEEGNQRCFIEDVPQDTLVLLKYSNPDFIPWGSEAFDGRSIKLTVADPNKRIVSAEEAAKAGRFAFTTEIAGEHLFCVTPNATRWFATRKTFRVDLSIEVGEATINYEEVASKEHLDEVELSVRRLQEKLSDVYREQLYQRNRESEFRNTSESTNARVQWYSVFQSIVVIAAGAYQLYHLKKFFASR